jgi:hypothetical protein
MSRTDNERRKNKEGKEQKDGRKEEWQKYGEKKEWNERVCKGKGKVVPVLLTEHHAMKAYWGSGCIAPLIL